MTKTVKIAFSDATDNQLYDYVTGVLNLDVPQTASRAVLLSKLAQATTEQEIEVEVVEKRKPGRPARDKADDAEDEDDASVVVKSPEQLALERANEKIKIEIPIQPGAGGDEPVPVSVNGRVIFITRGEVVEVARKYVEVLDNAVQYIYPENDASVLGEPRRVPMYPINKAKV